MLTYIIGAALFLTCAPTFFVIGLLVIHWFMESLPEELMDEKPKQYRKTIRTDPPALIRIKELGYFQPCGHHAYEWCSYKHVCLQCVVEGRQVAKDGGRQ